MLCISGTPYDTLKQVIYGVEGKNVGSLKDYNIHYEEIDLLDGEFNKTAIQQAIERQNPKIIYNIKHSILDPLNIIDKKAYVWYN